MIKINVPILLEKFTLKAFIFGMPFFAFAQQIKIQGAVLDNAAKPISDVVIILSKTSDGENIISYTDSDENGKYSLAAENQKNDSIYLIMKHLQFKTFQKKIPYQSAIYNIELVQRIEQLQEVLIAAPKNVTIKGDTITYSVAGLKAKKDYTIEEVIARIPGITISENGQISYLEKPISHLYINGLDLLESRYNIATQGIPASAVKDIEVLKKHNHSRIDIGRTESDKVALNLKINPGQSVVFGSSKNEVGVPFLTGLAEITPIIIKNKIQNITSVKANNIGESLSKYSENLTVDDLHILNLKLNNTPVIKPINTNGVELSNKYWLDNESFSATNDALFKITDSTLVKFNFNFTNERSVIDKQSLQTYFNNGASNVISNVNRNQLQKQKFQVGANQEINKRNFFLKNTSNLQLSRDIGTEYVVLNLNDLTAKYSNNDTNFTNSTFVKTIVGKKNIINSGLILEFNTRTEQLLVDPPVFTLQILSNTLPEKTKQEVAISKFNVAAFSEYAFDWLKINWNVLQNLQYNNFNFYSKLAQSSNQSAINFPFTSDFIFQKITSSTEFRMKKTIGALTLKLRFTADYNNLNSNEANVVTIADKKNFMFFQPFVSVGYTINSKWNSGISFAQHSSLADFSQIFQPIIMTSYNSLSQNPPIINVTTAKTFSPFITYSNILNSIFFSLRGDFTTSMSNVTFTSELNNNGFIATSVLDRPNIVKSNNVSLNFTKGIFKFLKTTSKYSFSTSESELFFNNQFINVKNINHHLNFGINLDNGSWYSLAYDIDYRFGATSTEGNSFNNKFLFHTANLDFYTSSTTQLHFGAESAKATTASESNTNTLFNATFFYKPSKKLFLKMAVLNIFDTRNFSTTFSSANAISISQFALRPRQITVGLTLSL